MAFVSPIPCWIYFNILQNIPQIVSQAQLRRAKLVGSQDELLKTAKGNPLVLHISVKVLFARGFDVSAMDEPRLSVNPRTREVGGWRLDSEMGHVNIPRSSPTTSMDRVFKAGQTYEFV